MNAKSFLMLLALYAATSACGDEAQPCQLPGATEPSPAWVCNPDMPFDGHPIVAVASHEAKYNRMMAFEMAADAARVKLQRSAIQYSRKRIGAYLETRHKVSGEMIANIDKAFVGLFAGSPERDADGLPTALRGAIPNGRKLNQIVAPNGIAYVRVGVPASQAKLLLADHVAQSLQRDCTLWQQLNIGLTADTLVKAITDFEPGAPGDPAPKTDAQPPGLVCAPK